MSTPLTYRVIGLSICVLWVLAGKISAQTGNVNRTNYSIAFYAGDTKYYGDLNPFVFGNNPVYYDTIGVQLLPRRGTITFGFMGQYHFRDNINFRLRADFGKLVYLDRDLGYQMNTPFNTVGLSADYVFNSDGFFQPYVSLGVDRLMYTTPREYPIPDLGQYAPEAFNKSASAFAFPIGVGSNFKLGQYASLFVEYNYRFTTTNNLDNMAIPTSVNKLSVDNDMMGTWVVGLKVQLIRFLNVKLDRKMPPPLVKFDPTMPKVDFIPLAFENLMDIRADSLRKMFRDYVGEKRAIAQAEQAAPEPAKIAVVNPATRTFSAAAALAEVERLKEEDVKSAVVDERKTVIRERTRLTWDPTIPRVVTQPYSVPDDILMDGIAVVEPPAGYYVQAYASVGPVTAKRAREMVMDVLKDVLEDPERQIIITVREKFFEVRIGVFDSYVDTIDVLVAIQGTFLDAYSLIYLP